MEYEIVALPKDRWKGIPIPLTTRDDIGRKEVRIDLGYFFHREGRRR